jgi:hypothetical protein
MSSFQESLGTLEPTAAYCKTIIHNGVHDIGGLDASELVNNGKIDIVDKPMHYWEYQVHAMLCLLATAKPLPLLTTDELRRGVEALDPEVYIRWGYYEKWASVITTIMLERAVFTQIELDEMLSGDDIHTHIKGYGAGITLEAISPVFKEGDYVRIKAESARLLWRRPHLRCPGYIYGAIGKIVKYNGLFDDPFYLAFRGKGPKQPLYSIEFPAKTIWTSVSSDPTVTDMKGEEREITEEDFKDDCIIAEIYQIWMEPYRIGLSSACSHSHDHGHNHSHSDESGHDHSSSHHHHDKEEGSCNDEHHHGHHDHGHRKKEEGKGNGEGTADASLLLSPSDPHYQHLQHHDLTTSYDSFDEKHDPTGHMRMIRSHDENDALNSSTFSVNSTSTTGRDINVHDQSTFSLAVNVSHSEEDNEDETADSKQNEGKEARHNHKQHHHHRYGKGETEHDHHNHGGSHHHGDHDHHRSEKGETEAEHHHHHEHGHHRHDQPHDHDHNHDHSSEGGGGHQDRETVERNAHEKEGVSDSPGKIISQALLQLLIVKGIVTSEQMTQMIEKLENGRSALRGAELVARAWKDDKFKEKLLFDGKRIVGFFLSCSSLFSYLSRS